ncbi:molecular chaperone DnaJ [uncultured Gimesia sp.]|uniref:molecular chaperone DnaJ n=1 Tax=uncultured Gimesia sp. TaxID=1678688 RepID=UPI00262CE16E|nr:molecular chaperone DnaJ [uncultured Gimesia sp.]
MASKRDYYEILGISREETSVEIKKAYKKLALANHPDRNPGDEEAIKRFKEAAEAFEVLNDDNKRAHYDRYGHADFGAGAGGSQFHDASDIFSAFGDLFEGFGFKGSSQRGRGNRPKQGESLRTSLQIDLLNAASGCEREINISRKETCETCHGSGAKPGTEPDDCDYCGGAGQVVQSQGFFRVQTTCPRCQGAGKVISDKCTDCRGEGRVTNDVDLDIKVPPGIDNGMQLCLRGEGNPGLNGGPRGDLYVVIGVDEHPLFRRQEQELSCHVPITYTQAALGAEIEIPTLEGRHELKIPSGTQPGEIFRLKGLGMPNPHGGGRKGDLHVIIQIDVPKKISEREEELLRELAEVEHAEVSLHRSPNRNSFLDKLKEYFTHSD